MYTVRGTAGVDFYVQFVHWLLCEMVRAQHVDARRWSPCFNVMVRAAAVGRVARLSCHWLMCGWLREQLGGDAQAGEEIR